MGPSAEENVDREIRGKPEHEGVEWSTNGTRR